MRCSSCGSDVPEHSRFCLSCGLDLKPTGAGAAPTAHATPVVGDGSLAAEALKDEYDIHGELGRGGMAIVYRATEKSLDREVAIKVLPAAFTFDSDLIERFQREARTAAMLEHPNIVPVYRVGEREKVIYFVMKFLRGGSLAGRLARRGRLPANEIRRILTEAGSALGYAAQRGVVHRDIKPDNIMFDEFGQSHLTDFGIARAVSGSRITGTGRSIGTPHYMSPEQARAQETDGRSDIYSLGVVAYECLTGTVPYEGDDAFAVGYKHITEALPTPSLTDPEDRWLYRTIERMLEKDPADRFQSCADLLASLNRRRPANTPTVPGPSIPLTVAGEASARAADTPAAAAPRSVATRSATMRKAPRRRPFWVVPALALAGVVAAFAFLRERSPAEADVVAVAPDSAVVKPEVDAVPAGPATAREPSDTIRRNPGSAAPPVAATRAASASRDSGALRVRNLPIGSTVIIDGNPATSSLTRLATGMHALAISAPSHQFFQDSVRIMAGETLSVSPRLTRQGARSPSVSSPPSAAAREGSAAAASVADPCLPGAAYNSSRCFDQRPRPLTAPVVVRPGDVADTLRPVVFWVHVAEDGSVTEVRQRQGSGNALFDAAARETAMAGRWRPARKDGAAVSAWTQMSYSAAD